MDEFIGKCTRLGDGSGKMACQTELYLDPNNEECSTTIGNLEEDNTDNGNN
jgi:hypothetical protein